MEGFERLDARDGKLVTLVAEFQESRAASSTCATGRVLVICN